MDISKKRIMADIKNLRKNEELKRYGIHVKFNEENIYNAQAMILGPEDTPYEKGFYFFDINFPSDYPMNPPKVKFCTLDGHVRFNPNLYACGKVCLSIIGTWSGPGWTSCLTLSTVLVSIQSLLNENPITNEPGFEKEPITGETSKSYNSVIAYNNIRVAIIKMMENTPYLFRYFKPIMEDYFIKYVNFYGNYVDENMKWHNKKYSTRIYSMNGKYDIKFLEDNVNYMRTKYCINETQSLEKPPTQDVTKVEIEKEKLKCKKKTPNENANDYDIGYICKSSNDEREYVVKQLSFNKKSSDGSVKKVEFKKWVLKK
jgi:ubiquitin-protein ligase